MSLLGQICAHIEDGPVAGASVSNKRSIGRSVSSYLRGDVMGRIMDSVSRGMGDRSAIEAVASHLPSMRRSARREYLTKMNPAMRRELLAAGVALREAVSDSVLDYTPEECWAIREVIDHDNPDAHEWLSTRSYLPPEVDLWYKSFLENRHSPRTTALADRLGHYRLVRDDSRIAAYMEGGVAQEKELNDIVDESLVEAQDLSEGAREALETIHAEVREKTDSFLSSIMSMYESGVASVVSGEVEASAEDAAEAVLEDTEAADIDLAPVTPDADGVLSENGNGDTADAPVAAEDVGDEDDPFEGVRDSRRSYAIRRRKQVSDDMKLLEAPIVDEVVVSEEVSVEPAEVPATPFAVGAEVQVSYMGNLYRGVVTAAGDGSIVVGSLPFEYFSARNSQGAFTGTASDMTFGIDDVVPYVEEGASNEAPVAVVEETLNAGTVAVPAEGSDDGADDDRDDYAASEAVGDSAAPDGFDEARAAALAEVLGVDTSVISFDDGHYGNSETGEWYLVLDESELPAVGLFASEADFDHLDYYIYSSKNALVGSPYEAFTTELPSFDDFDELESPEFIGLQKLVTQINNLTPGYLLPLVDALEVGGHHYEAAVIGHSVGSDRYDESVYIVSDPDYLYYKNLIDPGFDDAAVVIEGADASSIKEAAELLVREYSDRGLVSDEVLAQLNQSLRNVLVDSAEGADGSGAVVSAMSIIERVRGGETLASDDASYVIDYDPEGFVLFITPSHTEVVEEADAVSYLLLNGDVFGPRLGFILDTDPEASEVVADDAVNAEVSERSEADGVVRTTAGVTTTEDVDGEVITSGVEEVTYATSPEMFEALRSAVAKWANNYCFSLGQSSETSVRADAATALGSDLADSGFSTARVDPTVPRVLLSDQPFIDIRADGVYVGSTLFVYQTSEGGISAFSKGVADAAVDLAHRILDKERITFTSEVSDASDADGGILTEQVKQEVMSQVEAEVKKALEKVGLEVADSASPVIDVDGLRSGSANTFDIPHTASTFHKVRDLKRVMDSVLSVASDSLGERISVSQYRSLCKSSSKKAVAKVEKIADTAIKMDALDLLCPALYKERLTDSVWVCDSVSDVAASFGFSVSDENKDRRCELSMTSSEDAVPVTVGKSVLYLKLR